jgi:simple sugar transport system substrate-binding protein
MTTKRRGLTGLTGLTVALALGLTACGTGGTGGTDSGGQGGSGGGVDTERFTIAMVTHEAPGDTFWDKIRAGAEDAAQALNIQLNYSNNREAPEQATLVQNAVDAGVDGLAVTLAFADAVGPAAQSAAGAGMPVVAFNSGIDQYDDFGALMYFGSNETLAGRTVGERIGEDGGQKAVCVIQEQGSVALEARCDGVTEGFPGTERLYVQGTDLGQVRSSIGAKLQQDSAVTHIVTLGAPIAMTALEAVGDAGTETSVVTFDLSADAAQAIQDGRIDFSVDQQPYVQGFMAVQALWLHLTNGNDLGGGQPVLTGPSIVDESNIEQILEYAERGTR